MINLFIATLILYQQSPLQDYRWESRVLVIQADAEMEQINAFLSEKEKLLDRDMVILVIDENQVFQHFPEEEISIKTEDLRQFLNWNDGEFHLALIGKDGGIKRQREALVDPKSIYDLIDSMPMRRAEMRKGGN